MRSVITRFNTVEIHQFVSIKHEFMQKKWSLVKSSLDYQKYDPDISELDAPHGKDDFTGKDSAAGHSSEKAKIELINGQVENPGDKTDLKLKANSPGGGRKYPGLYFSLRQRGN